jgi:hypothetical protein
MTSTSRFLLALTLQGCGLPLDAGSGDAGTPSNPTASATPPDSVCAARSGSYLASYQERSGTCGPLSEEVVTFDGEPTKPAAPCTAGEYRYSDDNCEVSTVNVTCPSLSGEGSVVWNGKYTWDETSTTANGTISLEVDDSFTPCQSSYNIVLERL